MDFDLTADFNKHLKEAHPHSQYSLSTTDMKIFRQVVIGCGFSSCRRVFEASNEEDQKTSEEYFEHVARHFGESRAYKAWSYSVRVRNLLRQAGIDALWWEQKTGARYA